MPFNRSEIVKRLHRLLEQILLFCKLAQRPITMMMAGALIGLMIVWATQ